MARDRDGGYGRAVFRALPNAVQVADRWHLLDNCDEAFLAAVRRSTPDIRKVFGSRAIDPELLTGAERLYEGFQRRQQTNLTVQRMAGDGVPIKQIVRMTGLSHNLVRQILRGEREDAFRLRLSSLEQWLPWLTREWEGGCRNGAELWRRLRAKGLGGNLRVVGELATRQRRAEASAYSPPGRCPSARRIACMMTTARDRLSRSEAGSVARIEAAVPDLAAACALAGRFVNMDRNGEHDDLEDWLSEAKGSLLASSARGLNAHRHTVLAALREPWSNGQTEGQINKLKALKRQMYGRASLDLQRARLVAAA